MGTEGRELSWDDNIQNDSSFVELPEGDMNLRLTIMREDDHRAVQRSRQATWRSYFLISVHRKDRK